MVYQYTAHLYFWGRMPPRPPSLLCACSTRLQLCPPSPPYKLENLTLPSPPPTNWKTSLGPPSPPKPQFVYATLSSGHPALHQCLSQTPFEMLPAFTSLLVSLCDVVVTLISSSGKARLLQKKTFQRAFWLCEVQAFFWSTKER